VAADPVTRRSSSDAREAVASDVPAQLAAVPFSRGDDLYLERPASLGVLGAGVVRRFVERGPHPEDGQRHEGNEADYQRLVSHGRDTSDVVTVVGGGGVTLGRAGPHAP